jgi:hypothetical protein
MCMYSLLCTMPDAFVSNTCAVWCSWAWMAILLAGFVPLILLSADGCVYVDKHENNIASIPFVPQNVAQTLTTCFSNNSLSTYLNYNFSSVLGAAETVLQNLPSNSQLSSAFNYSGLDSLISSINSTTTGSIVNLTQLNDTISQVCALIFQGRNIDFYV